jgi:hypothetical protein
LNLSPLAKEWLIELNLLHRLMDDATESERAKLISKAERAADQVEEQFEILHKQGRFKELTARYKLHRKIAAKPMWWNTFSMAEKKKMVRALARAQVTRARRGLI